MFRHLDNLIRDASAHQAKIAGIYRDINVRQIGEQPVERLCRFLLEPTFPSATTSQSIDDVSSFPHHQIIHRAEQFWGILKIGINDKYYVAPHCRKSGM